MTPMFFSTSSLRAAGRLISLPCILLALLAVGLLAGNAHAAITVGNVTTNSADASSVTTSHDHNQGTNGLLVVSVTTVSSGRDITNVTYGGNALTHLCTRAHASEKPRVEIWYRVNPATGAQNVVVTLTGGADKTGVAIVSYGSVDQTTPVVNCASASGKSRFPSVNVTSAAGDLVQDALGHLSTTAVTEGGGQTEHWDFTPVDGRFGGSTEAGASTVTMSWTSGESKEWALLGFSIKAAPTCAAVADPSYVAINTVSGTDTVTVYWESANPVLILRKTAAFAGEAPSDWTTYSVGDTIGAATVVDNDTVVKTRFTQGSLTNGTTYHYKVFPKNATCYAAGTAVDAAPSAGPRPSWSYMMAGGSMLKPGIAGDGAVYTASNATRIISLDTATGLQSWTPVATTQPVQGWLSWVPDNGWGSIIGGDQSGRVYSVDAAVGTANWTADLSAKANAIQAGIAAQIWSYSDAAFEAAYTTDVIFAASRNTGATNCGTAATNNKLFALRADTGASLWTFNDTCTYSIDYIVGMPYIDYTRNRVYVASRGTGSTLWILNTLDGSVVQQIALGNLDTSPALSFDGATIYVGNAAGLLYAVDATTFTATSYNLASAVKSVIWEDWWTPGRLYFSTMDGNLWCLQHDGGASFTQVFKVAVAGASTPLLLDKLYVGSSDGRLHEFDTNGANEKVYPTSGTLDGSTVGDVSTEDGTHVFVGTNGGKLFKIEVPLP